MQNFYFILYTKICLFCLINVWQLLQMLSIGGLCPAGKASRSLVREPRGVKLHYIAQVK